MSNDSTAFALSDQSVETLRYILAREPFVGDPDTTPAAARRISQDPALMTRVVDTMVSSGMPLLADNVRDMVVDYFRSMEEAFPESTGDVECRWGALLYTGTLGPDGEPDYAGAVEHYTLAADHGNMQGLINLGYCHYYGRSVPVDLKAAYRCFDMAALTTGAPEALYKLGDMYRWGKGVRKNESVAFLLFCRAADAADRMDPAPEIIASVNHRLGDCLAEGIGCEVGLNEALDYYQRAESAYYLAIDAGYSYYRKNLRRAIEGEEKVRAKLLARIQG